jgi:hypothetical protein
MRPAHFTGAEGPARIVMTHGWLHEGEAPEAVYARATRVTVELFDEGPRTRPRTRMVFVQRGFPTPESRDGHDEGWRSTFRQLDALLEAQQVAGTEAASRDAEARVWSGRFGARWRGRRRRRRGAGPVSPSSPVARTCLGGAHGRGSDFVSGRRR